jgi:hypothetical protein
MERPSGIEPEPSYWKQDMLQLQHETLIRKGGSKDLSTWISCESRKVANH